MREIKFRIYDPNENKMIYDDICCYVHFKDNGTLNTTGYPKGYIIEQFTELKDRNGKGIYEGDIVEIIHPCWTATCITEFTNGSFIFRCINKDESEGVVVPGYTFMKESWKVKIIGNIHQSKLH